MPDLPRCAKLIQFDGANPRLPADRLRAYDGFKREVRELVSADADFARPALSMSDELLFASHNLAAPAHPVGKVRACAQRLRHGPAWQYARTVCASRNRIYILGRCSSQIVLDVLGGELCVS